MLSAHAILPTGFITGFFSNNIFYHNSLTGQREENSQFLQSAPPTHTCPALLRCLFMKITQTSVSKCFINLFPFPRMSIINFTFSMSLNNELLVLFYLMLLPSEELALQNRKVGAKAIYSTWESEDVKCKYFANTRGWMKIPESFSITQN